MEAEREEQKLLKNLTVEKLTWIRVGALGDLLVGLAALVETALRYPRAKITVAGPHLWTEIIEPSEFPYVEQIAVLEKKSTKIRNLFRPNGSGWVEVEAPPCLGSILRASHACVNLNLDSYRYAVTSFFSLVETRVGSVPAPMSWLYTHSSPWLGKDPLIHERDAALLMLELAESSIKKYARLTNKNRLHLGQWVQESLLIQKWRRRGLPRGKRPDLERAKELTGCESYKYILVNPTASRREKAWPSICFRTLLEETRTSFASRGLELVVLGAPHEQDWLKEVAGGRFRIVQPPNIKDLQDVLAGACGLLCNTSAVQFIAAMTGTPVMTLMGRAQPEIWGPLGPNDLVIKGDSADDFSHDIFLQEQEAYLRLDPNVVRDAFLSLPDRQVHH